MAIIHSTTMSPTKLELLASWLPAQPWYLDQGREPDLAKAGGFRLDDPQGEVGIEFMVVADGSGERAVTYLVPMTYRASPLAGAYGALIGTAEHGVLGRRWIYDGVHDPVLVAQLVALIQGDAEPQAQSVSDTPDPTVISEPVTEGSLTAIESAVAASESSGTVLRVETASADGVRGGQFVVRVSRALQPDGTAAPAVPAASSVPSVSSVPMASAAPVVPTAPLAPIAPAALRASAPPAPAAPVVSPASAPPAPAAPVVLPVPAAPATSAVTAASAAEAGRPCLTATWQLPDGTRVRGIMARARYV